MTERDALLRAVCEAPDDDTPRLVFADWLDEHGEPERAEFIRLQCELEGDRHPPGPVRSRLYTRTLQLLGRNEQLWRRELSPWAELRWGHFERGFVGQLEVFDLADLIRVAEVVFAQAAATTLIASIADLRLLVTRPELDRLRCLQVFLKAPPSEDAVRQFAAPGRFLALRQIALMGPTFDFASEDLLADRFGPVLHRGVLG